MQKLRFTCALRRATQNACRLPANQRGRLRAAVAPPQPLWAPLPPDTHNAVALAPHPSPPRVCSTRCVAPRNALPTSTVPAARHTPESGTPPSRRRNHSPQPPSPPTPQQRSVQRLRRFRLSACPSVSLCQPACLALSPRLPATGAPPRTAPRAAPRRSPIPRAAADIVSGPPCARTLASLPPRWHNGCSGSPPVPL